MFTENYSNHDWKRKVFRRKDIHILVAIQKCVKTGFHKHTFKANSWFDKKNWKYEISTHGSFIISYPGYTGLISIRNYEAPPLPPTPPRPRLGTWPSCGSRRRRGSWSSAPWGLGRAPLSPGCKQSKQKRIKVIQLNIIFFFIIKFVILI